VTHECTVVYDGQVLRPEAPLDLPRNSRYQVVLTPLPAGGSGGRRGVWDVLAEHAGSVEGPEDWSCQLHHYLYGTPKRSDGSQS
jgi:hypothetical protein